MKKVPEEKGREDVERRETEEEIKQEIEEGELEEDVYSREGAEMLEESDEVTELEEGFMEGYTEDGQIAKCAKCGKVIGEEPIEIEIGKEIYRFCSENCAESFKKFKKT